MKSMDEAIKIHDRYQCEIKLGYFLNPDTRRTTYEIETYLFFPNSLGINSTAYSENDFYRDMQGYIRLKTPSIPLDKIVDQDESSPFEKLVRAIDSAVQDGDRESVSEYEFHLKMFCCIVRSALRRQSQEIISMLKSSTPGNGDSGETAIKNSISAFQRDTRELVRRYRSIRKQFDIKIQDERIRSLYIFGDQYLGRTIEKYTLRIWEKAKDYPAEVDIERELIQIFIKEQKNRRKRNYPTVGNPETEGEMYIYRGGILKKFISNVLFLNVRHREGGQVFEQVIKGAAAGIAMAFAAAATFFAQKRYSNFSLPFFTILVISYIFKDRIKDWIRLIIGSRVEARTFDHALNIYLKPGASVRTKVGRCREGCGFVSKEKVPDDITDLRQRGHATEIENGWLPEEVFHYRKKINLRRIPMERVFKDFDIASLNDILRLNVRSYISRMDEPEKQIYMTDGKTITSHSALRIYHINMVMKFTMGRKIEYKRYRLVLNRQGIQRIEFIPAAKKKIEDK